MGSHLPELLTALTRLTTHWSSAGTQYAVAAAAGVDVDPIDIPPLYVLGLEGPARAGDLAIALRLTRPTMSKQLSRLERAGLIVRAPDPTDARASIIRLSATGHDVHERLVAQGLSMVTDALSGWERAEAALFVPQLTRFVEALTDIPTATAIGEGRPPTRS
jgi:DNA-binding MarR family transcriptional regulator